MEEPQRKFQCKNHPVEIDVKKVGDRWHGCYRIGNSSPYELNDAGESSKNARCCTRSTTPGVA